MRHRDPVLAPNRNHFFPQVFAFQFHSLVYIFRDLSSERAVFVMRIENQKNVSLVKSIIAKTSEIEENNSGAASFARKAGFRL